MIGSALCPLCCRHDRMSDCVGTWLSLLECPEQASRVRGDRLGQASRARAHLCAAAQPGVDGGAGRQGEG